MCIKMFWYNLDRFDSLVSMLDGPFEQATPFFCWAPTAGSFGNRYLLWFCLSDKQPEYNGNNSDTLRLSAEAPHTSISLQNKYSCKSAYVSWDFLLS